MSGKLLKEDTSMLYNKWVSGIAKRDLQPEVITINDIINRFRNRYVATVKVLPYPLQNMLDYLGELFVQSADLRRLLSISLTNPVIKEKAQNEEAIKNLNEKLDKIQNIIFSCTEDLNKIVEK